MHVDPSNLSLVEQLHEAQQGSIRALDLFLERMQAEFRGRILGKYQNCVTDEDELLSEFMIGVWKEMLNARLDVGNPLMFLAWKGQMHVVSFLRQRLKRQVYQICRRCGRTTPLKNTKCVHCKSTRIRTFMVEKNGDTPYANIRDQEVGVPLDQEVLEKIDIERFRRSLGGRSLQLFDMCLERNTWRQPGRNYLREIASTWGVSTPTVAVHLRRLRAKVDAFVNE